MSETDEISKRRKATVIAHRSPREGQQDVGHKGIATRGGDFSLCTLPEMEINSGIRKSS